MKIALVTTTLTEGGAQRVAVTLANSWVSRGHAVRILTFEPPGTRPDFALDERVTLDRLDLMSMSATVFASVSKNFYRIRRIRGGLRQYSPDVTLSLITGPNILAVLAGLGQSWPTIISERVHPGYHPLEKAWALLRRTIYPRADAIVVQSSSIAQWFERELGLKTRIIPNPIDLKKFAASPIARSKPRFCAMAAGRLDPQKGFDILVEAFTRVANVNPNWDLVIYGEGVERSRLEKLIAEREMSGRIRLPGLTRDITTAYGQADLFVHPARYEGYPNVIQEALAAGRPVVATDCPGFSRELLGDGRFGLVIQNDNVDALTSALAEMLPNTDRRMALAAVARSAVTPFEVGIVADQWIALCKEAIESRAMK